MEQAKVTFSIEALEEGEMLDPADMQGFLNNLNDLLSHADYPFRIGTAELVTS